MTSYVFLLSEFKRKEPQTTVDSREFTSWIGYWIRLINQNKRPGYISFEDAPMWAAFAQKSLKEKDDSMIRLSYMTADQISEFKKKETINKLGEGKIAFEDADREIATDTAPSGVSSTSGCGSNGPSTTTMMTEESEKVVTLEKGTTQKVEVLVSDKQATGAKTQKPIYLPTELVLGKEEDDLLDGSAIKESYPHVFI